MRFKVRTAISAADPALELEQDLLLQLETQQQADLSFVFGSARQVAKFAGLSKVTALSKLWIGGSSCRGALNDQTLDLYPDTLAVLQIFDAQGHYGVASGVLSSGNVRQLAKDVLLQAIANASCATEAPAMVWCYQAPGHEEALLAGFADAVGTGVPVFGGSSADNDINGDWLQYSHLQCGSDLLVVAVLFPSVLIAGHFGSGYRLTGDTALVSKAIDREIVELDQMPAADVYRRWQGLAPFSPFMRTNVLSQSSFHPIGRIVSGLDDNPVLLLSHPAYVEADQRMGLFSTVQEGERVYLLAGNPTELAEKAGEVVAEAVAHILAQGQLPSAAVIVFCGGCMLAIPEKMALVLQGIRRQLPELPFVVTFTFGEQGFFADGTNRHGNLMVSAVVFGSDNERT